MQPPIYNHRMDSDDTSKRFAKRTLFGLLAAALILVGFVGFSWSFSSISRGWASSYKLNCSQLIIGSACNGYINREGGGMCSYHTSFYTLSSESELQTRTVEMYMPLTTCATSVDVLTPVVDIVLARILLMIVLIGGISMLVLTFTLTRKVHD